MYFEGADGVEGGVWGDWGDWVFSIVDGDEYCVDVVDAVFDDVAMIIDIFGERDGKTGQVLFWWW